MAELGVSGSVTGREDAVKSFCCQNTFFHHLPFVVKSPLGALFLVIFFEVSGSSLIVPVFQYFCSKELGLNAALTGALFSAYNAVRILAAPTNGRLADGFGRRIVILSCFFATSVSLILMSLVDSAWQLLWVMIFFGFGSSGNLPLSQAMVSDCASPDDRTSVMGIMMAVMNIGMCISPVLLVMALYLELLTRRMCFAVGGLICFTGFCIGFCLLRETLPREKRRALGFSGSCGLGWGDFGMVGPGLWCIWAAGFFVSITFMSLVTTYAFLISVAFGYEDVAFGVIMALGGILGATSQLTLLPIMDRMLGRYWVSVIGNLLMGVSIAAFPVSTKSIYFHFTCVFFLILGMSLVDCTMPDLVAAYAPSERYLGFVQGFANSCKAIGCVIAPLVAGFLWDYSWELPFYVAAGSSMVATCLVVMAMAIGSSATEEEQDRLMGTSSEGRPSKSFEKAPRSPGASLRGGTPPITPPVP